MRREQKAKCHAIIHTFAGAIACSLAHLPGPRRDSLMRMQVAMVIALAKVFDIELGQGAALATLSMFTGSTVGRGVSQAQAAIGKIPGFGGLTNTAIAMAATEAIGWKIANNFSK